MKPYGYREVKGEHELAMMSSPSRAERRNTAVKQGYDIRYDAAGRPIALEKKPTYLGVWVALTVVVSVLVIGVKSCVGMFQHSSPVDASSKLVAPVNPIKISPIGSEPYSPYHRSEDLVMWRQYGAKGIARINHLRVLAAKKGSELYACDKVETSDLNDYESKTARQPVITAICTNGTRESYTQSELLRASKTG